MLDAGLHGTRRPVLVVARPFAVGSPPAAARRHVEFLADVLRDLAARGAGVRVDEELIDDYASVWLSGWYAERARSGIVLTGAWAPWRTRWTSTARRGGRARRG